MEVIERFTFMIARMAPVNDSDEVYVRESDYLALQAQRDEMLTALQKISEWGCNGQCVDLVGTLCPCCIAAAARRRVEEGK